MEEKITIKSNGKIIYETSDPEKVDAIKKNLEYLSKKKYEFFEKAKTRAAKLAKTNFYKEI
jgi:hypothetical protein